MSPTNRRGRRLRARPFYAAVLILSLLTAYSFLAAQTQRTRRRHARGPGHGALSVMRRAAELECSDVRSAPDQCGFVRRYCKDDDAGLIPYLEFYYCAFSRAQPVAFVVLVLWLGLLFTTIGIAASDFFSVNLSTIAAILGLSQSLAGVTFLALGNGSPDVFSTFAAMSSNSPSMAVGELLGAACFITGVVAGSMALVREFRVDRKTYVRDICFFIVAISFTMFFLADQKLHFWECWAMIAYYAVYVVCVVGWHWYSTRRRRRLRREGEARSHFYGIAPHSGDELAGEPYRDDPDDVDGEMGPPSSRRSPTTAEAVALEQGRRIEADGAASATDNAVAGARDDEAEGHRERMLAAQVTRNMRVLRTGPKRHHNINPIRPSLVGALEFRAALAQLQRESNLQLSPISGRSHSENHVRGRARRGTIAVASKPYHDGADTPPMPGVAVARRDRALSSGDVPASSASLPYLLGGGHVAGPFDQTSLAHLDSGRHTTQSYQIGGNLAPPPPTSPAGALGKKLPDDMPIPGQPPRPQLLIPSQSSGHSGQSSPSTPFPVFTDSPVVLTPLAHSEEDFMLPGPAASRVEGHFPDLQAPVRASGPVRWWPYSVLPAPHVLLATMFPTLQGWREKTHWDKFVSAVSVPTIFLLVITLPVVEPETNEEDDASTCSTVLDRPSSSGLAPDRTEAAAVSVEPEEAAPESEFERRLGPSLARRNDDSSPSSALPGLRVEDSEETMLDPTSPAPARLAVPAKPASDPPSTSNANDDCPPWDRWLVCLQLFTGPLFAVFILWANFGEEWDNPGKALTRMVLYTLLGSLVLLALLLMTTTEHARPRFHFLLCFLGFIISIAWISTIAGEVVGVLKAFGVILGISEALLGLTIFAAGNSIGDLVADITVARLGYPVMALSACFGGPMLNILLGIGVGGVMMMMQDANHKQKKHPERRMQYGPYPVEVGGTLMISSITLLMMLFLLLILVPMNKWILSRKIGWSLIALWTLSTVVNVVLEVTGIWGAGASNK